MRKSLILVGLLFFSLVYVSCGCTDINKTPKIEFIEQEGWLRVSYIEKLNLTWDNINITLSSNKYSEIGFHSSSVISALKPYGNGSSCPNDWGVVEVDNGIMFTNVDAIVTLYWIPTNTSIGEWDFI